MQTHENIEAKYRRYVRQEDIDYPMPPRWQRWIELLEIAPEIESLGPMSVNQRIPPDDIDDRTLLALAACFSDRKRREILRALILDLLADDLAALIEPKKGRAKK